MRTVCAWCGDEIRAGTDSASETVSHGVCITCCGRFDLLPTEGIPSLARSDVDRLPFGVIVMDEEGMISKYNSAETELSGLKAAAVIGRGFFTDVAPCTNVREFAGRVHALQSQGRNGREAFDFVFSFENGELVVEIVCLWDESSREATLLVHAAPS